MYGVQASGAQITWLTRINFQWYFTLVYAQQHLPDLARWDRIHASQALEKRSLLLVRLLRRQYAPSLARDEHLGALLDAIEAIHFHVVPPAAGMGGLLNNMLQMLASEDA